MSTVIFPLFSTLIFPQLFCQLFRKAEPETRIILKLLIFNKNIIKSHKDLYTRCSVSVRAILGKEEVGFFFFFFFFCNFDDFCKVSLRERCPYSEFFWIIFFHIRTVYRKTLRTCWVWMRGSTEQKISKYGTFHAL